MQYLFNLMQMWLDVLAIYLQTVHNSEPITTLRIQLTCQFLKSVA